MASIGQELLNVPFPSMVRSMGLAIAQAQYTLDMNSIRIAQMMSGSPWIDVDDEGLEVVREGLKVNFGGRQLSLLELGFTPTFYQFVDTVIEVKISMSMKSETEQKTSSSSSSMSAAGGFYLFGGGMTASVSTVSASFAARNSFSAEGSSLIRTKLVPLPAPAVLQERIRAMLEDNRKKEDAEGLTCQPGVVQVEVGAEATVTVTLPAAEKFDSATVKANPTANLETPTIKPTEAKTTAVDKLEVTVKGKELGTTTVYVTVGKRKGELKVLVVKPKDKP